MLIAVPVLFSGCKKDKEVGPGEKPIDGQFLISARVPGAAKITVDNVRNFVQIVLPEPFVSDIVDIELVVSPGAELELSPWTPLYTPSHVKYYFKGLPPEHFTISRNAKSNSKSYTVYVQHEGPLAAELTSSFDLYASGTNNADGLAKIRIKSGLGSLPETPDGERRITPVLENGSRNVHAEGFYDDGLGTIFFESILGLLDAEGTTLSLKFGTKTFQFPEKLQLKRAPAVLYVPLPDRLFKVFPSGQNAAFDGGIFLDSQKYTLKLQNDPEGLNITLPAVPKGVSTLETQFPASLPDGQYKVEFFENTHMLTRAAIVIARDSTIKAIGQVWTGGQGIPWEEIQKTQPVTVTRGQELFVNPFPAILDASTLPFDDKKKVPDLTLKLNGKVTQLPATVKADPRYADNSMRIYYGSYRIPDNLSPGLYEAALVTGSKQHSLPYWTKIEVR